MTNTKKIDHTIRCISDTEALVSKAFAKRAVIYKTEEYILWHDFLKDYPNAKMVTKTIKKNSKKRTYRNLTYVNMELFISVAEIPSGQRNWSISPVWTVTCKW